MTVKNTPLFETLAGTEFEPRALDDRTGGLVVTVRGARILGVFLEGFDENLLWVNDAVVGGPQAVAKAIESGEWNSGGDRAWYSPEIELHFLDPANPSHTNYAVPADLDPGAYHVKAESERGLMLKVKGGATNLVRKQPFKFKAKRAIRLCEPPFDPGDLSYVGYELSSELRIKPGDDLVACYGLWQLMQIPPGGTLYIPTRGEPELVDYFRTGVASYCSVADDHVRFPVTGTQQQKLGLRADHVRGLAGYLRPVGETHATLIVRQTATFPGAVYADYPADARERRDVPLQFYNDGGAACFGEMEYHAPAAIRDNFFRVRDVSRTWCLGGPIDQIKDAARRLLGIANLE